MLTEKTILSADSLEVQREYYSDRITLLETLLKRLTILEHPVEIRSICDRIIAIKNKLRTRKPAKK